MIQADIKHELRLALQLIHWPGFETIKFPNWTDISEIIRLPIARHWTETNIEKVKNAKTSRKMREEAILATIEALTIILQSQGWIHRYTSAAESRYYRHPNFRYEIRISHHNHPNPTYWGMNYIITPKIVLECTMDTLLEKIENDFLLWKINRIA